MESCNICWIVKIKFRIRYAKLRIVGGNASFLCISGPLLLKLKCMIYHVPHIESWSTVTQVVQFDKFFHAINGGVMGKHTTPLQGMSLCCNHRRTIRSNLISPVKGLSPMIKRDRMYWKRTICVGEHEPCCALEGTSWGLDNIPRFDYASNNVTQSIQLCTHQKSFFVLPQLRHAWQCNFNRQTVHSINTVCTFYNYTVQYNISLLLSVTSHLTWKETHFKCLFQSPVFKLWGISQSTSTLKKVHTDH